MLNKIVMLNAVKHLYRVSNSFVEEADYSAVKMLRICLRLRSA